MTRRKGELSKGAIDRGWPHQVALHSDQYRGHRYRTVQYFCVAEQLSLCVRNQGFYRGAEWYISFCFAEREHAERFQKQFGGEFIDPKDRPRWPGASKRSR